jgi:hypothetical protein
VDAERSLGVALPADYKQIVSAYGSGCFNAFVRIFNPIATSPYGNLLSQRILQGDIEEETRDDDYPVYPHPVVPAIPGILPFGITDNGNVLFWIVGSSDTARWTLAVNDPRSDRRDVFHLDLVSFLCQLLVGEIRCSVFPDSFPGAEPRFEPSIDPSRAE